MPTKWTPEVIAAEKARKQAANIPLNYGKTPAPVGGSVAPKQTPMMQQKPVNLPFKANTPVSTWGGASPINGGVNTPPKPGAPVPYSAPKVSTPSMLNSATNTGGTPPSIGYGGATYGQSGAGNQAIMANQNAIKGTAGFRDSEVTRSQGVIRDIESQLQNDPTNADLQSRLAGAKKYLGVNLGYSEPVNTPPMMQPQDNGMSLSRGDIAQEVDYGLARERADLENTTNRQTNTVKNNADYANKLLQDNRVLQDVQFNASANPFAGKSQWDKGLIGRQRAIDDTHMASELTNQLDSISQDLYNWDKLAPDRRRALMNEMIRIERDFGLREGELLGMYRTGGSGNGSGGNGNGPTYVPTLAARELDWRKSTDQRDFSYQEARDKIKDEQYKKTFDEDVRQFGLKYALDKAQEARQLENTRIDNARQASGGSGGGGSGGSKPPSFSNLMSVWRATGKAPKGLESVGIQPGTPYEGGGGGGGGTPNYDETPDWASEIEEMMSDPAGSYEYYKKNSRHYIDIYGDKGYKDLLSRAKSLMDEG